MKLIVSLVSISIFAFGCAGSPTCEEMDTCSALDSGAGLYPACQPTVYALEGVGNDCHESHNGTCSPSSHPFTLSCSEDPFGVMVNAGYKPSAGTVGDFLWCCHSLLQ